ncbi:hypothetical protein FP435_04570 [Lactobacillus sp. PV037]|uniref:hypothetical protein n=1 Tax=Lactobacillus sp. PV037 TaxID=2594496 RepID=UPI00223F8E43|nr:hypothetical protein [Lactobacillus sp. PV037]QNQ83765.1 hypothetical protein FP435_04570 [Lactobacillus sp. PV037]
MASDAQKRAVKNWKKKNKDKDNLYNYRSKAKKFIRDYMTIEDLKEFKKLIQDKEKELLKES